MTWLRRWDVDFINEFHARSRGIRGGSWTRWLFGRGDWRVGGGREKTNRRRRRVWEYPGCQSGMRGVEFY